MFSIDGAKQDKQNGMDQHWIDEQIDAVQSFATECGNFSSDGANEIKHGKLSECGYGSSDGANETKHGKLSKYSSRIYQKLFGKALYLYLYFYLPRRKKHDCNTDGALQRKLQQINLTQNRCKSAQKFKTKFATNRLD